MYAQRTWEPQISCTLRSQVADILQQLHKTYQKKGKSEEIVFVEESHKNQRWMFGPLEETVFCSWLPHALAVCLCNVQCWIIIFQQSPAATGLVRQCCCWYMHSWGVGEDSLSAEEAFPWHSCCSRQIFTTANLAEHEIVAEVNNHNSCSFECLILLLFSFASIFNVLWMLL